MNNATLDLYSRWYLSGKRMTPVIKAVDTLRFLRAFYGPWSRYRSVA